MTKRKAKIEAWACPIHGGRLESTDDYCEYCMEDVIPIRLVEYDPRKEAVVRAAVYFITNPLAEDRFKRIERAVEHLKARKK